MSRVNPQIAQAKVKNYSGVEEPVYGSPIAVDASNTDEMTIGTIITRDADGNASAWVTGSSTNPLGVVTNIYKGDGQSFRNNVKPASTAASLEYVRFADGFYLQVSEDAAGGVISTSSNAGFADIVAQTILGNDGETLVRAPFAKTVIDSSTFATSVGSLKWTVTRVTGFDTVSTGGTGTNYGVFNIYPVTVQS
jgi:hypothetical protein